MSRSSSRCVSTTRDNVLGPLQFDNNINTNQVISSEISLLDQHGSTVTLGNVIILPFNNDSFLYVRPNVRHRRRQRWHRVPPACST